MKKQLSLMLLLAAISFVLTSCKGDEPNSAKLSNTSYVMYHEDSELIKGTDISGLTWNSDNEFVATVKNREITAQYVGKTTVKSETKGLSFKVEVKPRYHTYEEPSLKWGASISEIKAIYGTPKSENATGLMYMTNNSNVPMMIFVFENGKMTTCGVVCQVLAASQLGDFLLERYVPVNVDINKYTATFLHCYGTFSNPKSDYGVGMQYNSSIGGILVAYTELTANSKASYDIDFQNSFDLLGQAMSGVQL